MYDRCLHPATATAAAASAGVHRKIVSNWLRSFANPRPGPRGKGRLHDSSRACIPGWVAVSLPPLPAESGIPLAAMPGAGEFLRKDAHAPDDVADSGRTNMHNHAQSKQDYETKPAHPAQTRSGNLAVSSAGGSGESAPHDAQCCITLHNPAQKWLCSSALRSRLVRRPRKMNREARPTTHNVAHCAPALQQLNQLAG
jgi:hypothetical protein